jgi:SAM-dependent methyltransferase
VSDGPIAAVSYHESSYCARVGFYREQVLPRFTDKMLSTKPINRLRRRVVEGLQGDVLEIGFGSGTNVPFYPSAVRRVLAVDPATLGRKLAAARVAATTIEVDYIGLDGEQLPLADASVDHALSTFTMCTIPHVERALGEVRRVLRPGGTLHFLEHGRSPDANIARWQDRLNPLEKCFAGGCHLNRPIDDIARESGFTIERLENFYLEGPKPFGYMYEGVALPA